MTSTVGGSLRILRRTARGGEEAGALSVFVFPFLPHKPVSLWWIFDFIFLYTFLFKNFDLFVLSIRWLLFFASGHKISGRFLPFAVACCRYFVSHLMLSNRTPLFETLDFFLQIFVLPRIEFEFRDLLNVLHATIKPLQIMNQCFSVFLGWLYCFNNGIFFPLNRFSHSLQPSHKLHLKLGRLIIVKKHCSKRASES